MTQALQLLTVVAVGFGLACYGLFEDRREHRRSDRGQRPLAADAQSQKDGELLAR